MSQMTPEAPATPAPARAAGGGNVFTRKLGPLPMWLWLLIGVGLIGGYYLISRRGSASGTSTAAGGTTSAAQVPQFVNQTYTTIQPPVAPTTVSTPGTAPAQVGEKTLTVPKNETLQQYAKNEHWTDTTLAAVEALNNLKPGAKLKKGQKIKRPWAPIQPGQTPLPGS